MLSDRGSLLFQRHRSVEVSRQTRATHAPANAVSSVQKPPFSTRTCDDKFPFHLYQPVHSCAEIEKRSDENMLSGTDRLVGSGFRLSLSKRICRSETVASVYSRGEFPRSNPSTFTPTTFAADKGVRLFCSKAEGILWG